MKYNLDLSSITDARGVYTLLDKDSGYLRGIGPNDEDFAEIKAHLLKHPEARVTEPGLTEAQKAARKAQEDEAKELALDMAWIRAERKKAKP